MKRKIMIHGSGAAKACKVAHAADEAYAIGKLALWGFEDGETNGVHIEFEDQDQIIATYYQGETQVFSVRAIWAGGFSQCWGFYEARRIDGEAN